MNTDASHGKPHSDAAAAGVSTGTRYRNDIVASFEAFVDELAAAFARVSAPEVDGAIEQWLRRIVEFFDADRSSLAQLTPEGFLVTRSWARPGYQPATLFDHSFQPQGGFDVAWELDFWGKFRRNTESAQANLLATDEARYVVMATLVTQVADAYLTLRALDLTLEISQRTVKSRVQSVDLVQARLDGGVAGVLDLRQAETLLYGATKAILDIQRQIEQQENFIDILLGQNPGPIERGRPLDQQITAPALPPGLPLDLLTRRRDIRQAEHQLVSANAQIGVATALLYPQVTISGFAGVGGATISGSNFGPFGIFSALPAVTLPIFNMGRLKANVDYNEALAQQAGLNYQQTLQQALREVSDALVGVRKRQEFRQQQELLVKALEDASQVANMRYEGGVSRYLEVLDTERELFQAQLDLVQAKRDESSSVIQLYKALGGGWQTESPATVAAH